MSLNCCRTRICHSHESSSSNFSTVEFSDRLLMFVKIKQYALSRCRIITSLRMSPKKHAAEHIMKMQNICQIREKIKSHLNLIFPYANRL